mgnify:CR=1 FL=1
MKDPFRFFIMNFEAALVMLKIDEGIVRSHPIEIMGYRN